MSTLKLFAGAAVLETISWIVMLVAMFFKYVVDAGWAEDAVSVIAQVHGFLVIIYLALLFLNAVQRKWGITKIIVDFIAMLVPGMGFWVAKEVLAEDAATSPAR